MSHDPSSLKGRLVTRLGLVRGDLWEAFGRLEEADLGWAPTPGMRTVSGQLQEIAQTEMQVVYLLKTGEAGKYEEFSEACRKDSLTAYRDLLTAVRNDTLSLIDSLTDQELESGVAVPQPWFESLRLPLTPRSEVIRSISAHEWYHVGQIVSYLWSRGDDPYQW